MLCVCSIRCVLTKIVGICGLKINHTQSVFCSVQPEINFGDAFHDFFLQDKFPNVKEKITIQAKKFSEFYTEISYAFQIGSGMRKAGM